MTRSSRDGRSQHQHRVRHLARHRSGRQRRARPRLAHPRRRCPQRSRSARVHKADAREEPIMQLALATDRTAAMRAHGLRRPLSRSTASRSIDGVARVRSPAQRTHAMRVWLDRRAIAARGLTVDGLERALRRENVERPVGPHRVERSRPHRRARPRRSRPPRNSPSSSSRGARTAFPSASAMSAASNSAPRTSRNTFRANGRPTLGIGIVKQSTANTLEVARAVASASRAASPRRCPQGMQSRIDQRRFGVRRRVARREVVHTLAIADRAGHRRDLRCSWARCARPLIPAVTVPISLIATFIVLYALRLSINMLTLLALVLAIGLVVDDAIVVRGEHPPPHRGGRSRRCVAAYRGTRQVGFAVVATTLVLIAVFVPITFMQGQTGRLFRNSPSRSRRPSPVSALVALTLSPMLASHAAASTRASTAAHPSAGSPLSIGSPAYRAHTYAPFAAPLAGAAAVAAMVDRRHLAVSPAARAKSRRRKIAASSSERHRRLRARATNIPEHYARLDRGRAARGIPGKWRNRSAHVRAAERLRRQRCEHGRFWSRLPTGSARVRSTAAHR